MIFRIKRNTNWYVSKHLQNALQIAKTSEDDKTLYTCAILFKQTGEIGAKETPQQKFQRLQHEIRELTEEVTQIKDGVKVSTK